MGSAATTLVAVWLAGCGRVGFATEHDGAPLDGVDEAIFDQPFGPAIPLTPLHSPADDDDPSMTEDALELYFSSNRIDGVDRVFRSKRTSIADPWPAPVDIPILGTSANNARVSLDGLAIYFASERAGSQLEDVYRATRPSRDTEFGPAERVVEVAAAGSDYEAAVASATSAMFFTSDRQGDQDLYEAPRQGAAFGTPIRLAELASATYEGGTWASADGRRLWFHRSSPTGRVLLQTRRATASDPFEAPVPIPGMDSASDEQDPWVSPDGHTIVFASDRGGSPDLYFATR